jgi:hypothetical protein
MARQTEISIGTIIIICPSSYCLPACLARPTLAANVTKSFGSTFLHNLLKKRTFEKKEYTTKLSNSIT